MEPKHLEALYPPDCRFTEIEKIIKYVKSGNSAQLVSLPGVGRSNTLGLLAFNRKTRDLHLGAEQKDYHFVLMNFAEVKSRDLAETTKFMFLELLESLRERKYDFEKVSKIFDESIKSSDELVIFQGLKNAISYISLEKELTVVFLFDRFDEYIPSLRTEFFSNLRVLRDLAKYHFSCMFPVNRPLEDNIGHDMLSDFYEFLEGNLVYLQLSDEKMLDFRVKYLEERNGQKISKQELEEILKQTGGHGKLTRVCIEESFAGNQIEATNKRISAVLLEIWKALNPYEQNLTEENKAHESTHLVAVGLVKENMITIPLLLDFARTQKPELNEKIEFDSSKNEIRKGEVAISHGLTSSEFKLLKFFVENPNQILERDQIIESVWGDLASTLGVTEQALDQLIFRLRKKIEENPNSPTHIKTIKGRGFEFSS